MQEHNPYAPPESNLTTQTTQFSHKKTIEEALASDYNFSIGDVLSNAWSATKGFKMYSFLACLIILVIAFIIGMIEALLGSFLPEGASHGISFITNGIITVIFSGLYVLSLKHLRGESIRFLQDFFSFSAVFGALFAAYIMTSIMTLVGFILIVIPGIYLAFAYSLTLWIILDHPNIGFWQAMEASRKLVSKHWFKVFGLYLIVSLILIISALPLGIGLIWTMPLLVLSTGTLYRIIFGEIE